MQHRKRRKPTHFLAELEVNQVRFSLHVVDITQTGAKLRGTHEVIDGTHGELTVRGQKLPGVLRWVEGSDIGFEFDATLTGDLYAILTRTSKKPGKPKRFLMD